MENDESSDTSNEIALYSVQGIKRFVLEPTKRIINMAIKSKDRDLPQEIFHNYIELNKRQLEMTKNDIKNNRFPNEQLELDEIKAQLEDNIAFLQKPIDDYKQRVQEEIEKIDISRLNENSLTSENGDSPFDKIVLAYKEPFNDITYGKLIRNTMMVLQKYTENNIIQMTDLKDQVNELRYNLDHIDEHMKICVDLNLPIEDLPGAKNSLKILIDEVELYLVKGMIENTKCN